jgi:hypothetical protein
MVPQGFRVSIEDAERAAQAIHGAVCCCADAKNCTRGIEWYELMDAACSSAQMYGLDYPGSDDLFAREQDNAPREVFTPSLDSQPTSWVAQVDPHKPMWKKFFTMVWAVIVEVARGI